MVEQEQQQKVPKTKYWKYVLIIVGILTFLITPIAYNKATEKCAIGEYENGFCKFEIKENQVCEGTVDKNICVIDAKGDLEDNKILLWLIGILIAFALIYFIFHYIKKPTIELEEREYKKFNPKQVKKEVEKYFLDEFDIPHQKNTKFNLKFWQKPEEEFVYQKGIFEWYDTHLPFIKSNGEWFFQGQVEINGSKKDGIYTILVSMAREAKEINEGLLRWSNQLFEYYKLDETQRPFYQPRTQSQKIYERLIQLGREDLLTQFAQKEAESLVEKTPTERMTQPQQIIQPQQFPQQQPYYPYQKRGYQQYQQKKRYY